MSKIMITTCDICGKKEEINLTENEVGTFDSLWSFKGEPALDICQDCIERFKKEVNVKSTVKPAFRDPKEGIRQKLDEISKKYG